MTAISLITNEPSSKYAVLQKHSSQIARTTKILSINFPNGWWRQTILLFGIATVPNLDLEIPF